MKSGEVLILGPSELFSDVDFVVYQGTLFAFQIAQSKPLAKAEVYQRINPFYSELITAKLTHAGICTFEKAEIKNMDTQEEFRIQRFSCNKIHYAYQGWFKAETRQAQIWNNVSHSYERQTVTEAMLDAYQMKDYQQSKKYQNVAQN